MNAVPPHPQETEPEALRALESLRQVPPRNPRLAAVSRQRFLDATRALRQAVSSRPTSRPSEWKNTFLMERRPMPTIVSLLLAVALALGGAGATAYPAQDSLPTERLYGIKLMGEQVQLVITPGPQGDLDLPVGFVAERVQEMTALAARGEEVPARVQARLQEQLQLALQYAAQLGDAEMIGALAQIRAMAQNQVRTLEQARRNAPEQAEEALQRAEQVMNQVRITAEGGLEDPLTFRQRQSGNRPEEAPEQPDTAPRGNGNDSGSGTCDDCTPQPTGTAPHGPRQGRPGPGGPP